MGRWQLNLIYLACFWVTVWGIYSYSTRDVNSPELTGLLSQVQCLEAPQNEDHAKRNRAIMHYDSYDLYHVCLPKSTINRKHILKCDYNECGPNIEITQEYFHSKDGRIFKHDDYVEKENYPTEMHSRVKFTFAPDGARPIDMKVKEKADIKFTKKKLGLRFPSKFQVIEKFYCTSTVGKYTNAGCVGILRYQGVDIRITTEIFGEEGQQFKAFDLKKDIMNSLELLDAVIQPASIKD